ncbi:MAG TPA: hypothetical protein VJX67_10040 [Blastocatellia bacterium]|nr:hypothetical protein [Blastocatellia bacterium]
MRLYIKLLAMTLTLAMTVMGGAVLAAGGQDGPGAQGGPQKRTLQKVIIEQQDDGPVQIMPGGMGPNTFFYVQSESLGSKLVKGAPYSAQAVTSFTQVLADGNRISRQSTASIYRDSEGRTRREETLGGVGPWSTQNPAQPMIFINDPVAGVNYILNSQDHTATKIVVRISGDKNASLDVSVGAPLAPPLLDGPGGETVRINRIMADKSGAEGGTGMALGQVRIQDGPAVLEKMRAERKADTKTEDLGSQSFDGVVAQGTRNTITIPVGQIGNDLPIQEVNERWFSPDLGVVVMTRHSDPRMGETVYKLTNINRAEPAASLFTVPDDYTIKQSKSIVRDFRFKTDGATKNSSDSKQ